MSGAVLLVDGGQSECRTVVVEGDRVRATRTLPGLSYDGDAGGVATVRRLVSEIAGAIGAAVPVGGLAEAWLGLSGMPRDEESRAVICRFVMDTLGTGVVAVCSDLVPAYVGALGLGPGGVISVGSGAVALAVSAGGNVAKAGNHGALLGDQGSAYWTGRAGLRAAVRASDSWGEPTALVEAAHQAYGALASVHGLVRGSANPVNEVARFAPYVCKVADEGDVVATNIVRRAGALLAEMLAAATREVMGNELRGAKLSWNGRFLAPGGLLMHSFEKELADRLGGGILLAAPRGSALDGLHEMAGSASLGVIGQAVHIEKG